MLCGYRPVEIAARLVKTAKGVEVDLCNTLYRYVETLTGRSTNTVENWRDIVDWLQAAGYKNRFEHKKVVDWGEAPDVSVFYGRTEELATLKQWIVNDGNFVSAVAFSPDDKYLATASWDKTARVWDTTSGQPVTCPLAFATLEPFPLTL